jgi:hypothetical protein
VLGHDIYSRTQCTCIKCVHIKKCYIFSECVKSTKGSIWLKIQVIEVKVTFEMGVRAWTQVSGVKLVIRSQEPEPLSHQGPLFKIWFWSRILYFNHLNFKSNWSLGRLDTFRKYVTFFNMHTFESRSPCFIIASHIITEKLLKVMIKTDKIKLNQRLKTFRKSKDCIYVLGNSYIFLDKTQYYLFSRYIIGLVHYVILDNIQG